MNTLKKLLYAFIERKYLKGCSNYNSLATRKSCRSKRQARQAFSKNGMPHAEGAVFYGILKPFRFAARYGFPLVVKPNVSGFSRGSHFPITTYGELLRAIILAKIWWPASIVEHYLEGKNYRVVLLQDEILSVIRRYPPFVRGDGQSTIAQLIDRENETRASMELYPVIHPLTKNSTTIRFLKKKHLGLSS
ncbi:MAG: cyanophycin synthetase, partial [Desulfopila sp.]